MSRTAEGRYLNVIKVLGHCLGNLILLTCPCVVARLEIEEGLESEDGIFHFNEQTDDELAFEYLLRLD